MKKLAWHLRLRVSGLTYKLYRHLLLSCKDYFGKCSYFFIRTLLDLNNFSQLKLQIFGKSLAIYASNDLIYVLVMLLLGLDVEFEWPRIPRLTLFLFLLCFFRILRVIDYWGWL